MGDHTDYNGGLVLPIAIGLECLVAVKPRSDGEVVLRTLDDVGEDWTRYVDAVRTVLGPHTGVEGVLASSVPPGSGLSSSAALEVAVALALGGGDLSPVDLALACQKAEHLATGVPSGVMDQIVSIAGRTGRALLIDCRSLELRHVRIPDDAAIVVVHSGVQRTLERSEYAERRAACERIAAALEAGEIGRVGELMRESHASLRDDFRVSTPKLDALVEELVSAGALGARLTGAGFGGCVVAIAPRETAPDIVRAFPAAWTVEAANGAGPLVLQPCRER